MKNSWAFIQGWFRYYLYYSILLWNIDLSWLIRKHIRQQINTRINSMNLKCYRQGSCIKCGCATTALQMADKACEGDCYPKMLSKKEWKCIWNYKRVILKGKELWAIENDKFVKL